MQRLHQAHVASLVALLLAAALVLPTTAAPLCLPEREVCLDDRFRQYWEQHGGLAVFGFATTAPAYELNRDLNQRFETQWFERNRLELHPENAAPYNILLGRLGDDRAESGLRIRQGRLPVGLLGPASRSADVRRPARSGRVGSRLRRLRLPCHGQNASENPASL